MIICVEYVDAEAFAVGVDTRRVENGGTQGWKGRTQSEIDVLRFYAMSVNGFIGGTDA